MRRASIDIGSNSILLLIAQLGPDFEILANEANVTGLGRGLDETGLFSNEAMNESLDTFKQYSEICKKFNVETSEVIVTATEASRVAKNAQEFYSKIKSLFGFNVKIISGEGEAYYSSMGVLLDRNIREKEITIMDIGGASTEIIKVDVINKRILNSFSMPIGVVRITNWRSRGIDREEINKVFEVFEDRINDLKTSQLFCVAGTMTSVGNIYKNNTDFVEAEIQGLQFPIGELKNMYDKYHSWTPELFLSHFPFLGKRSQTISAGFELAISVMDKLNVESIYISTYGLRYGTLFSGGVSDDYLC